MGTLAKKRFAGRQRSNDRKRGQSTVEFALLTVLLTLFVLLLLQVSWLGVQKWYFNFVSLYAARSWSVTPLDSKSPNSMLMTIKGRITVSHPGIVGKNLADPMRSPIPLMTGSQQSGNDPGIKFTGRARPFPIFEPFLGSAAGLAPFFGFENQYRAVLLARKVPLSWVTFESFIPIESEEINSYGGKENPNRYDNDCSRPCNDNAR